MTDTNLHRLFNNDCYLIEASTKDIRCENFELAPQVFMENDAPNGYHQEMRMTITYVIDGDSLKITRK